MKFLILARGAQSDTLYHAKCEDIEHFVRLWKDYSNAREFRDIAAFTIQELTINDIDSLLKVANYEPEANVQR